MNEYKQSRWSLKDILDEQQIDQQLEQLEQAVAAFEALRPQLTPDISESEFLDVLRRYEELSATLRALGAYAELWFSEDTQNQAALSLQGRLDQIGADASNRLVFFSLWVKDLPDESIDRLMQLSGDRRYFIDSLRRFKPYLLSESEEQLITLKDVNGIEGLLTLYEMITNKFEFNLHIEGDTKTLTRDELQNYFRNPSPEVRAAAYQELYRVFAENSAVLAQIYTYRARDWHSEMIDLRHFAEPISMQNLANDIPDRVIDTILNVCRQNSPLFQRYFKLKAKWLNVDKLRRYDIYAPLAEAEKTYTYQQATDLVLSTFNNFSPKVSERAQRVFDQGHLDAEVRPGKRGGAFCYAVLPTLTPWVLLNFNGRPRDVAVMAHELGHAVHAMLAADHSILTFHSALPLAETASVFSEMLMTDRLLHDENDKAVRRDLLSSFIDDAYATVLRQAYISIFEREAHRLIVENKSIDEVCALCLSIVREQFGDAVEVSDEFKWEWITIPHSYGTPFYTYAYSFGQLLVLALYQQFRNEGEPFKPRYLKILASGGSASPAKILNVAGIDITSAKFWQGGFDVIKGFMTELEQLSK
ncbi:MAG TPA: M3 family oligoendopeptidase [Anaerolineae bacterium]|nr:M3 family oligoendopeptidase [Anaerolineae bacterium]